MPTPRLSQEKRKQIEALIAKGYSQRQMTRMGFAGGTVSNVFRSMPAKEPASLDVRRLLKVSGPLTIEEMAKELRCSKATAQKLISEMKRSGALLHEQPDGSIDLISSVNLETQVHEIKGEKGEWQHVFGIVSDNHLCNKHSRLDVLGSAYDHFARLGIRRVLNAGNWVDGEARFNKTELMVAPGMDRQLDYMIDVYPEREDIETLFIAGDDHEGWYQQREGVEVGKYLQMRAESQGRRDLKYLGYGEADIRLKFGTGFAVGRLVHPGGGSAYAISYTDQKRVESYQGGEKPHFEIAGHYHKFNYGYPREVHTLQAGCTCDQTMFMRKKRLQAHVGYSIVKIKQMLNGAIERFAVEWFPSYDRGFYEKRF